MKNATEAIKSICPHCQASLKITRMLAPGTAVPCPRCNEVLRFHFNEKAKNASATQRILSGPQAGNCANTAVTDRTSPLSLASNHLDAAHQTSAANQTPSPAKVRSVAPPGHTEVPVPKSSELVPIMEKLRRERRVFELQELLANQLGDSQEQDRYARVHRWVESQRTKSESHVHEAEIRLLQNDFVEAFRLAGVALQCAVDNCRADQIRVAAQTGLSRYRWRQRAKAGGFIVAAISVAAIAFVGVSLAIWQQTQTQTESVATSHIIDQTPQTGSGAEVRQVDFDGMVVDAGKSQATQISDDVPVRQDEKAASVEIPTSSERSTLSGQSTLSERSTGESDSSASGLVTLSMDFDSAQIDDLEQQTIRLESNGHSQTVAFSTLDSKSQDRLSAALNGTGTRDVTGAVPRDRTRRKWALLVGVNQYDNLPNLNYCEADMGALRDRFVALGFPDDQIVELSSHAIDDRQRPSRDNIVRELNRLLSGSVCQSEKGVVVEPRLVGSEDTIVVAFSGHGVLIDGVSRFCPVEADMQDPAGTMISMNYVYEHLASVTDGLRLLLVDACRNQAQDPRNNMLGTAESFQLGYVPPGIAAISSCSAGQVSHEDRRLGHGIFSYYLLGGLAGAGMSDRGDDGYVDIKLSQLTAFTVDSTMQYTHNWLKAEQKPQCLMNVEGNPVLGRIKADDVVDLGDIHPAYPPGPQTRPYALNLHRLRPQELPFGWKVPEHVVTRYSSSGRPVLCSNINVESNLVSPRLNLQRDFAIEVEVSCDDSEFHMVLEGAEHASSRDDLSLGFRCDKYGNHDDFEYRLPTSGLSNGEWQELPLYKPEGYGTILIRLERRGSNYQILLNNDERRCVHFRNLGADQFERIRLVFQDAEVELHAIRVGPLQSNQQSTGVTIPYHMDASNGQLPNEWRVCGEVIDGSMRLLSPVDAINMQGDFNLTFHCRVVSEHDAAFRMRLIGANGGRTLPIEFFGQYGNELSVVFPKHRPGRSAFNIPGAIFWIQLLRVGDRIELRLGNARGDARTICVLPKGGGFQTFDQIEIDDWSGNVLIPKLSIRAPELLD